MARRVRARGTRRLTPRLPGRRVRPGGHTALLPRPRASTSAQRLLRPSVRAERGAAPRRAATADAAREGERLMPTFTQDTDTWCDPHALPRDECGCPLPSLEAKHRGQLRMAYRLAVAYAGRLLHVHGI